jgi:hypothetical protein
MHSSSLLLGWRCRQKGCHTNWHSTDVQVISHLPFKKYSTYYHTKYNAKTMKYAIMVEASNIPSITGIYIESLMTSSFTCNQMIEMYVIFYLPIIFFVIFTQVTISSWYGIVSFLALETSLCYLNTPCIYMEGISKVPFTRHNETNINRLKNTCVSNQDYLTSTLVSLIHVIDVLWNYTTKYAASNNQKVVEGLHLLQVTIL